MSIIIGSARIDENGNTTGGAAGDQTGNEVSTQAYYTHSKGWYCLRPTSTSVAAAMATAMQQACDNNCIGYDQNQRTSYLSYLKSAGSFKAITTKCECDCSSLVRGCIYQATGTDVGDFNTSSEVSVLEASGLFETHFSVSSSSDVYNGDVLVTKTKGHTVIVVSGRARSSSSSSSSGSTSSGTSSSTKTATKTASSYDASLAGTYAATASLNMRNGAGTSYSVMVTLPKGTSVKNYGYYTSVSGTKWLYVQCTYNSVTYTGFCSSNYLSRETTTTNGTTSSGTTSSGYTGTLTVDGYWGAKTTKRLQTVLGTTVDGVISSQDSDVKKLVSSNVSGWEFTTNAKATGSECIRAMQKKLSVTQDGLCGKTTIKALQKRYGTTQDGCFSAPSAVVKALQKKLNSGTF